MSNIESIQSSNFITTNSLNANNKRKKTEDLENIKNKRINYCFYSCIDSYFY